MSLLQKRFFGLRLRTWALFAMGLPLAGWGSLNLLFSTSPGTGFLCDKIEQRTGLPCQLKSATWSPWAGVTVREFRAFAAHETMGREAILSVDETRIDLSWTSLLKGRKRWERLEIEGLEVDVSVETLHEILARNLKTPAKPSAVVPLDDGKVEPVPGPDPEGQSPDQIPTEVPVVREDVPEAEEEEVSSVPAEDSFEGVIVLSKSRVKIYSERVPSYALILGGVEGEIPLWGGAREGVISFEKLALSEGLSETRVKIPLKWKERSLSVMKHPLKVFGLNVELSAAMKLTAGFPIGAQLYFPDQQLDLSSIFQEEKSPLSVGNVTSSNRLQGYFLVPASFRGSSVTQFRDVVIDDPRDEGELRFDRGGANFGATVAGVVARDVRAIGEEDAILFNGFAKVNGEAAVTVRIVSSPERAQSHAKRVRMAGGNLLMDFQPLITPDREFRDIRIEARDGTVMMDLGEDRSWVSFFAAAKAILGR